MLLALIRRLVREDAPKTSKRREPEFVTPEQLELALEEHMKDITYEWNETYEKFAKLHLRLSKRDQRAKRAAEEQQFIQEELPPERASVLHYPSPWRF